MARERKLRIFINMTDDVMFTAEKLLTKVIKEKETLLAMCEESYLAEKTKERPKEIISSRIGV